LDVPASPAKKNSTWTRGYTIRGSISAEDSPENSPASPELIQGSEHAPQGDVVENARGNPRTVPGAVSGRGDPPDDGPGARRTRYQVDA
jgi:hypothetical protein